MKKVYFILLFVAITLSSYSQNIPDLVGKFDQLRIYLTMPYDVESELQKKSEKWLMESYVNGSFVWSEWKPGYVLEGNSPYLVKLGLASNEKVRRDGAWMKGQFKAKSIFSTRTVNLFVYAYYDGNKKIFKWTCNDYPDCSF